MGKDALTVADGLILLLSLVLIGWLAVYYWGDRQAGETAEVRTESGRVLQIDLRRPQRLEIQGYLGISELEVKEGKIRFIASPCANKHCIRAGWIHRHGELAACLPNRVSVQIQAEKPAFDALVY